MNILAVDTAGKTASVALMRDGRLLYEVYLDGGLTHSETLLPMIDTCLKLCGMTCADIDLYGVNAGSVPWTHGGARSIPRPLTWKPTPVCWTTTPGRPPACRIL